jgi:hypothetical protein
MSTIVGIVGLYPAKVTNLFNTTARLSLESLFGLYRPSASSISMLLKSMPTSRKSV